MRLSVARAAASDRADIEIFSWAESDANLEVEASTTKLEFGPGSFEFQIGGGFCE